MPTSSSATSSTCPPTSPSRTLLKSGCASIVAPTSHRPRLRDPRQTGCRRLVERPIYPLRPALTPRLRR
jgi:hypothetical protein